MKQVVFGLALFGALVLSFRVGVNHGLKTSPEYVAAKERDREAFRKSMKQDLAEYKASGSATCDKIFEIVSEDLARDGHSR